LTFALYFYLLSHPLILLIVGTVLSGLVIPRVTSNWKARERQIETILQWWDSHLKIPCCFCYLFDIKFVYSSAYCAVIWD